MEIVEGNVPGCALKCLRNVEDVSHSVHPLKYGVNTIGRGLNNDIVLKNLNVSRTHCHLRVEKKGSLDIAYVKDLGTSNGTVVGNINLIEFQEHELNDLDMIVLASGDEGVVLQYIDKTDRTVNFTNLCKNQISNKRKVLSVENLDEPTAVKIPKMVLDVPSVFKEPNELSNKNKNVSTRMTISSNTTNNIQQINLKHSTSTSAVLKPVKDSVGHLLCTEKSIIDPLKNIVPSCSHYKDVQNSVKIKTEPININNVSSQGTYRNEEDSVIVIYSSDEESNLESLLPNIKIELENMHVDSKSITDTFPHTSKIENKSNLPEWSIHCQRNETVSEDEDDDDLIYIPPESSSSNNNVLMDSNDSDSDYNSKFPKVIEPLPLKTNIRRGKTKVLVENENIIKTRARSERRLNNKKEAEEFTADQNKQIIQDRRLKLQHLAEKKSSSLSTDEKISKKTPLSSDDYIDKCSTTEKLKKKTRISRLQGKNNDCAPSTSKLHLVKGVEKNMSSTENLVKFNKNEKTSMINLPTNLSSSSSKVDPLNFAYFDTLSIICKWNAVWLHEEKFVNQPPPLVKTINKMKGEFENPSDYSASVKPLLLYEIWSKISESYNMILSKNPNLEKYIFEKSLKKDIPLHTFDIQSVNKDFFSSSKDLKSINRPLWCLKCIETNKKNKEQLTGPRFSLKGYLCIVIIQSKCFETDPVTVKQPTKSRSVFFAYVNVAKKIGHYSSSQLYIELIVTKKTEIIPNGTTIHLMDIFYLHSELRLFQAINNVTTSSLSKALITPQFHNYTLDHSRSGLKSFNINSITLNNSQKEAVKMAVTICSAKEPNVGLIVGPPGTGKTNVICNIILTLMSKHAKTNTRPKLLICAPSNEAVDAIVKRIIEMKNDVKHELQFTIVRVGSGQKYDPHSPITDVMLDNLVKYRMNNPLNEPDQAGKSNTLSVYTNKKDLEDHVLKNTDVVLTTLNSCFSKTMENAFMSSAIKTMNSCHFTACIVDEAGQSIEPLNCVPILLGVDKLILVGDDKQLQPLIKSKMAKDNGLGVSLFKRLKTWFEHYQRKSYPITMLDIQYRMHHEICQFPSAYFYKGLVKTAPSVKMRKHLQFQPYLILEHENQQDSSGEINVGEANMIVSLVEILLDSECKSLDIAILTPYHKQREQIHVLLGKKDISLNVNTIDSFQGGECDILLISTVRTNGVGFLDDICRLNVALTRARQSLIICGNFKSLKGEQVWCDLLKDAKKRKLIKKVSKNAFSNSRTLFSMIKY